MSAQFMEIGTQRAVTIWFYECFSGELNLSLFSAFSPLAFDFHPANPAHPC
jgi:hypothetical protein